MADDQTNQPSGNANDDAADPRQNVPRTGIPGKGFDAGTGYGGAGNDALYSAKSSYGGQSGIGGSRTVGAYAGEGYGRSGPGEDASGDPAAANDGGDRGATPAAQDTDGRGSANTGRGPVDPNDAAVTDAFNQDKGPDAVDMQDMSGGSRREPGR